MDIEEPDNDDNTERKKRDFSAYAKYSAAGFQMFAVIAVFAFIGYKIDENRNAKQPLFTAFFSLVGVLASLYLVIRSIKNLNP
jgi:F0F1-type ATP synthase assembly protein I